MKPNLHFKPDGQASTLCSLVAAIIEDNNSETRIKAAMAAAVARHVAESDWMLVDALTDDELARASAILTGKEK